MEAAATNWDVERPFLTGRHHQEARGLSRLADSSSRFLQRNPAVHRGYMKLVPRKMTDRDFWTKYCRAEYLQHSDNVRAAAAEAAEDEELALFLKPDDILANQTRQKIRRLQHLCHGRGTTVIPVPSFLRS